MQRAFPVPVNFGLLFHASDGQVPVRCGRFPMGEVIPTVTDLDTVSVGLPDEFV